MVCPLKERNERKADRVGSRPTGPPPTASGTVHRARAKVDGYGCVLVLAELENCWEIGRWTQMTLMGAAITRFASFGARYCKLHPRLGSSTRHSAPSFLGQMTLPDGSPPRLVS